MKKLLIASTAAMVTIAMTAFLAYGGPSRFNR
jgi:hypothetical protein